MPRKTRKQKERSHRRRSLAPEDAAGVNSGVVKREFTFSFDEATSTNYVMQKAENSDLSRQTIDVRFELSDLIKTLALASGVFVLELVIYFAWFEKTIAF